MIDIKDISGKTRLSIPINKGAKGKFTLMKEDYIILPFSVARPVQFKLGDYVDLSGALDESLGGKLEKIYEITDIQKPTYNNSTGGYDYNLQMNAYYWKWKSKIFKYTPEHAGSEASWSLTAALDVQLGVFLRNLKALGYTYKGTDFIFSIDDTVENKAVAMTYDNINLLDALFSMAGEDKWNCDCWITDNVIHFGRCEFGDAVKIERGVEASSITRSESQGTYATRIYAFGSTRNIPTNYRPTDEQAVINGVVQKRLMLPADTPYIDAYEDMSQEEAIEDVVVFDDVYPRRVGALSDVHTRTEEVDSEDGIKETVTYYRYKDTELEFKEEYILEGAELKIQFQSGKLNGMEFGVIFNPKPKDESRGDQLWEIVRNEDYGRPLPDEMMYPANGDEYILSGFDIQLVSDQYIPEAEQELKKKAQKYADKVKKDDGTYPATLRSSWVKENLVSRTFEFGQRINLIDDTYFEDGRISRVLGWEMNLDIPWDSPVYIIGESMPYSRIGEIEDKVDSLTYKGQTYVGSGSGVYLIRVNDRTAASDSNVFSALRALQMFHRKDKTDENSHLQKFLKGIELGEFVSGMLGTGGAIQIDQDGNSHAEFDYLTIRKIATFIELIIQEAKHVGGMLIVSPSGMTISKVEETDMAYRCYFERTDGDRTLQNQFTIGTQARRQTFNLTDQAYYWRLVTSVGDDYVDLSKTDCDTGSTAPQPGDELVGMGHRTDQARQSAIIISSFGTNSPSIMYYQGIDSYSLVDKAVKMDYYDPVSGRFKSVTYGDTYVGDKDGKTYIKYNQEEGVEVSGKVKIQQGSEGAGNFTDLPEEIMKAVKIGGENLLRNTGFTGDYTDKQLSLYSRLNDKTKLYSENLIFWTGEGLVSIDSESISGFSCTVGHINQKISLIQGETYTVSYRAKGSTITIECGGTINSQNLSSDYGFYTFSFVYIKGNDFSIRGDATICDIKLERGTVYTDWCPSVLDSPAVTDRFKHFWYLQDAMKGSTDIIGGLILSTMIQLGKYTDGIMEKVNAGISGIYNDDNDIAYWAGGTFEQAIKTVQKLLNGENPSDEDWEDMAKFVATHGGNIFLRGLIYAMGGIFKNVVIESAKSPDGAFKIDRDGVLLKGDYETRNNGKLIKISSDSQSIEFYNEEENLCISISFSQNTESSRSFSRIRLKRYDDNGDVIGETIINPGSIVIRDKSMGDEREMLLSPRNNTFTINGTEYRAVTEQAGENFYVNGILMKRV